MIEIIPLKLKDIFDREYITSLDIIKESNNNCYITSIELISKLMIMNLPIKNKRLAISNILNFLNYFDGVSDNFNIAQINSSILIQYFTTKEYKKYMKILTDNKILTDIAYKDKETPYKYIPGEKSKRYRTFDVFNNSDLCLVVIDSNKPLNFDIEPDLVSDRFRKTICDLEMNYKNAICDEIDNFQDTNMKLEVLRKRISRLLSIRIKRYIKSGTKVSRIYHSLSNLSKISRKHTLIQFNNIDIINCQPLLLCAYLLKNGYYIDDNYKTDCEEGILYENFVGKLKRDDVKVELYKSIYFKFNKSNKYNKMFKDIYPLTWNSLNDISKSKISMASILQNFEASLFNNLTPKKSQNYYTLFDAIYYDNIMDSGNIVSIIEEFFNQLNVRVGLSLNGIKVN